MRRKLPYLILMGTCVLLFVLSWAVVRRYSAPAAIAMTILALAIPPFAAIVANAGREGGGPDQGSDEPPSR
jgi:ABC-type methionine transport system permease subunit